jgi:hypothetical protein
MGEPGRVAFRRPGIAVNGHNVAVIGAREGLRVVQRARYARAGEPNDLDGYHPTEGVAPLPYVREDP